jgi:hypothetical protein
MEIRDISQQNMKFIERNVEMVLKHDTTSVTATSV